MLKIAVVGLGNHAQKSTIPALQDSPLFELVGVCSRSQEKTKKLVTEYGFKCWDTLEELLEEDCVDVIYISTPTGLHYSQAEKSLKKGKHVFCEKSLTPNYNQTKDLCELAENKGLLLAECFMYFYHAQYRKVIELIADGHIGKVCHVSARFGFPHLASDNIRYSKELGGGALLDAGVYPFSVICRLFDSVDLVSGSLQIESGYSVDTSGAALCVSNDGCTAVAQWGMGRDYSNDILIWGSEGQISGERIFSKPPTLETKIRLIKNGKETLINTGSDNHFVNMFEYFASCVGNEVKTKNLISDILSVASIVKKLQ